MRKLLILLSLGAVGIFAMGADDCAEDTSKPVQGAAESSGGGSGSNEETADTTPKAEANLKCDYLLGEGFDEYSFIAGGSVKNTGDVPATVKVTAKWTRLGSDPVIESRTVTVKPGKSKDVQMSVPASSDDIDTHQSADGDCSVRGKVVG